MPKRSSRTLPLAALLATALAQTITSTIPVCPTASSTTITLPTTVTFCPGPHCNGGGGPMITAAPTNGPGMPGIHLGEYTSVGADGLTTVLGMWETVYNSMCSTGLVPATWTITQPCPCENTPHPTVLPTGFETTVIPCSVCGPHTSTVTLTQPCPTGPYATQTPSVGQAPAAASSASTAPAAASSAGASAAASASAGASAQSSSGSAAANAKSGANASAQSGSSSVSPASASAKSGANAQAAADMTDMDDSDVDSASAAAAASASASAMSSANTVPPASANGMRIQPVSNSTTSATNGTMPIAPMDYINSGAQTSIAGFAVLAGILAAFLL